MNWSKYHDRCARACVVCICARARRMRSMVVRLYTRLVDSLIGEGALSFDLICSPKGEWADPGGTAIPGQPVTRAEQAPDISSSTKNQFNIEVPQWGTYQILS